jgi:plastocyanin
MGSAGGARAGRAWRLVKVALVVLLAGVGSSAAHQAPDEPPVPPDVSDQPKATVLMTNDLRFEPQTVTIHQGDNILWRNRSRIAHTVTDTPDKPVPGVDYGLPPGAEWFDSGEVEPSASFGHRFDIPGVYHYACIDHGVGGMVGVVRVLPRR